MPFLIRDPETSDERIHELKFGINTVGRDESNSIVILHGYLSRYHAKLFVSQDCVTIENLNSLNGTFVNEVEVDSCELKIGDLIRCASVVFRFVDTLPGQEAASEEAPISIVKRFSPERTRMAMQHLLYQERTDNSVLKLQHQDTDQRVVDKLEILLEVSKQLSSPEEPDQLLKKVLDLLLEIMSVDRAAILMVSEETGELECKAVKSPQGGLADQFYSKRITSFVREKGDAILTADACLDALFNDSESVLKQGIHAAMCIPLKPRQEVIGVLYVDNLSLANVYSEGDLVFLTCLVNQAAIAIENARLYKKMQAEAVMRDKLERFFPQAVSKKLREEGNLKTVETEVTALISDISSFTKMSSEMEPCQVIEMLNEYFKVMVEEIVFPYEGTLEKYIGDALVAVWGAPYRQANDPVRAVRAAIEMQWAVYRLNKEWEQRRHRSIQIHIGLNTGRVAAGNIGSERLIQYAHIGDTINMTSRICSAAQAGEILISQSTFDKLDEWRLPVEKLHPVRVKGKDQPLQLYRILWTQVPSKALTLSDGSESRAVE